MKGAHSHHQLATTYSSENFVLESVNDDIG
jgi:hypothetical protein